VSLLLLTFLLLLASQNNPAASAVATDSAVADVVAGVPATVDAPGVPAACYSVPGLS
jgi:hypothetical protein